MSIGLEGLPGKMKILLDRLTHERAQALLNLDQPVSQCAPASTALLRSVWTDGLAGALATTVRLNRAEMLSIIGAASGGALVLATRTIASVTIGKCILIPVGGVVINDTAAASPAFALTLQNSTTVQLRFTLPGAGTVAYSCTFALLAFT